MAECTDGMKVKLEVFGFDNDGKVTGSYVNESDLICQQWAQFVCLNILSQGSTITVKDITGTVHALVGTPATITALTIQAGIGTTAASVTDVALGTITAGASGTIAGTVTPPSESSGTSGTFVVSG